MLFSKLGNTNLSLLQKYSKRRNEENKNRTGIKKEINEEINRDESYDKIN